MYRDTNDGFIILKRNALKGGDREVFNRITTKRQLTEALVKGEIYYTHASNDQYTQFISNMEDNPFIRGHVKHINIYNLYSNRR